MIYDRYNAHWSSLGKKYSSKLTVPVPLQSPRRMGKLETMHELALHYAPGIGFVGTIGVCIMANDIITFSILLHSIVSYFIGLAF